MDHETVVAYLDRVGVTAPTLVVAGKHDPATPREANEYIIVNPLLTDANDWGVHRDSAEVESVRVDYLNGQEEPTFFLADLKNAGMMFVGDRLTYKLRLEFGVVVADYRGAVKAVVA